MTSSKSILIEEIINDALGDLANWQKPIAEKSIGPKFPELGDEYRAEIYALKKSLTEMLSKRSPDELIERFQKLNHNGRRLLQDRKGTSFQFANAIRSLKAREPAWFISGWHVKTVELDTAYWRAFSSCTLSELTLLSVGLDPRNINYNALFMHYGHLKQQDKMLDFLQDQSSAIANGLGASPDNDEAIVDLLMFYTWAKEVKFKIDSRFRTLLREKFNKSTNEIGGLFLKPKAEHVKPIHRSTYNFHAKLFYAIAIEKYGLKSEEEIGRIAKKIQGDAELQGHTAAIRPIRQLLKKGYELSLIDDTR